jgi:AhpD family alkylhydroperoxidase
MNTNAPINEQVAAYFGDEYRPEIFKRLADNEPLLAAIWSQYQIVMSQGEIDVISKEMIGLAVAIVKPNEYFTGLQQRRVRRAGVDLAAEQEVCAVAALCESLGAFARSLCVEPEVYEVGTESPCSNASQVKKCVVSYLEDPADGELRQVYDEIRSTLGVCEVPNIFRAMAHHSQVLTTKWTCYKRTMLDGIVPRLTKELVAIAVSAVSGWEYCASVHSAACRQLGLSERGLVEVASTVDLFVSLCTLAKGFRLGKRNL